MTPEQDELERLIQSRILIVEDEGIVAKDLTESLSRLGYTVVGSAATGAHAIDSAVRLDPDLVLMDIRLRGPMDGIEAARRIRERSDIPVVFLTAYADPDTLRRAAEIGPFGYVLKPFDTRELEVTIMMALCKHRAFAELDQRAAVHARELALTEARYRRLESVVALGLFALEVPDTAAVCQRAVKVVTQTLQTEIGALLERAPGSAAMKVRAAIGWPEGASPALATGRRTHAGLALDCSEPIVVADLAAEARFSDRTLATEAGAVSGAAVVVHTPGRGDRPYGVLCTYSRRRRELSEADVSFLQAVANVVATAIARASTEAELREAIQQAQEERVRAALAEEALRTRDEFLSVASHELRTPVGALHLQLRVLRELLPPGAPGMDPRIDRKLDRAAEAVTSLGRRVEAVLDVSRIAAGKLVLHEERFDLAAAVRSVGARHQQAATRAGCELRISARAPLTGSWDRARVEQVIANLLSNAIKFGAGAPIDITLEPDGDFARIRVRDRGAGIDPTDAERILGRFERAVSHRRHGGLGLGLYVAGAITRAHGGSIEIASPPDGGAELMVRLPLSRS